MSEPTWQTSDGSVRRSDKPVRIYALLCPATRRVRYVGKTTKTIARRVVEHVNISKRRNRVRLQRWIRKVGKPIAVELQVVPPGGNWQGAESRWIRRFKDRGCDLCNHTAGGEGLCGHVFTQEHRDKIAAAIRSGRYFPCEVCGERFYRKRNEIAKGECRFCSRACYAIWQRNQPKRVVSPEYGLAGRIAAAANRKSMTHCKRGHRLAGENLYVSTSGRRVCKECRKIHKAKHREVRRGA